MISINSPLRFKTNQPYDLRPIGKDYLWGGTKIHDDFVKEIDLSMFEPQQPMWVLKYSPGCVTELLEKSQYFHVERMLINTDRIRENVDFLTDDLSSKVRLCIDRCGVITAGNESISAFRGDCIFFPANSVMDKIHGRMQLLCVSC